jgi:uncharacterized DUF497 family protein
MKSLEWYSGPAAFNGSPGTWILSGYLGEKRELMIGRRKISEYFILDPDHSESEDRWLTMGVSNTGRLVVVSHTFRRETEDAATIRIISVRKASKRESQAYGEKA